MRRSVFGLAMVVTLTCSAPIWAAEQNPQREVGPPRPGHRVGVAVTAAACNVVYFPVRLAVTTAVGAVGGVLGWFNGGDSETARSLWDATEGQAYITPGIIERRERLRFGPR